MLGLAAQPTWGCNMRKYLRWLVPGGTYFFSLVTHGRRRILTARGARTCLRDALTSVRAEHPFSLVAIVLLPDHLHAVWELPPGDAAYSMRWNQIKGQFTRDYLAQGGIEGPRSRSLKRKRERAVWQRRFYEHTCRIAAGGQEGGLHLGRFLGGVRPIGAAGIPSQISNGPNGIDREAACAGLA